MPRAISNGTPKTVRKWIFTIDLNSDPLRTHRSVSGFLNDCVHMVMSPQWKVLTSYEYADTAKTNPKDKYKIIVTLIDFFMVLREAK